MIEAALAFATGLGAWWWCAALAAAAGWGLAAILWLQARQGRQARRAVRMTWEREVRPPEVRRLEFHPHYDFLRDDCLRRGWPLERAERIARRACELGGGGAPKLAQAEAEERKRDG